MNFSNLLDTPELRALKAGKDEHPFTYCMQTVVPAMAEKGKAPENPEAFCGWWKAEHATAHPDHEESRHLHILAGGTPRVAQLNGREHLVIPVVALMEGVIHAVNADEPEFVPTDVIQRAAHTWNGRPLVVYHPNKNGKQISANHPEVIQRQCFGQIFESKVNSTRLGMEAWIDPQRLRDLGELELLANVRAGKPIEVSVGAYVKTRPRLGTHNGRAYKAEWTEAVGDHLAFLPRGRGACSLEMGCGAHRAASETPILYTLEGAEPEALGGPGSGNFGHEGRPGQIGGSGGGDGDKTDETRQKLQKAGYKEISSGQKLPHVGVKGIDIVPADRTVFVKEFRNEDDAMEAQDQFKYHEHPGAVSTSVSGPQKSNNFYPKWVHEVEVIYDPQKKLKGMSAESFMTWFSEHGDEFRAAIGARNSSSDAKMIQNMHDSAVALGATCDRSNYKLMESRIKNEGGKWVIYSQDQSRRLSSHDTKAEAETQEKLIEAARVRRAAEVAGVSNKNSAAQPGCSCKH